MQITMQLVSDSPIDVFCLTILQEWQYCKTCHECYIYVTKTYSVQYNFDLSHFEMCCVGVLAVV